MEREMLMFEEYLAKKTTTSIIYTYSCLSLLPSFCLFTRSKKGAFDIIEHRLSSCKITTKYPTDTHRLALILLSFDLFL